MGRRERTPYAGTLVFLLSQVGAQCARVFAARLAPLGLTPRGYAVLSHLATADRQTQQQLADRLGIHRNNMVAIIDELEAAGWVERRRSSHDRRAFEIHLTEAGAAMNDEVARLVASLERELTGSLAARDRTATIRHLERLAAEMGLPPGVHPSLRA
jgi:DNA-binding MarR family transcriptional regulator